MKLHKSEDRQYLPGLFRPGILQADERKRTEARNELARKVAPAKSRPAGAFPGAERLRKLVQEARVPDDWLGTVGNPITRSMLEAGFWAYPAAPEAYVKLLKAGVRGDRERLLFDYLGQVYARPDKNLLAGKRGPTFARDAKGLSRRLSSVADEVEEFQRSIQGLDDFPLIMRLLRDRELPQRMREAAYRVRETAEQVPRRADPSRNRARTAMRDVAALVRESTKRPYWQETATLINAARYASAQRRGEPEPKEIDGFALKELCNRFMKNLDRQLDAGPSSIPEKPLTRKEILRALGVS